MTAPDPDRLLTLADQILAGDVDTPRARSSRSAAILGRTALERLVQNLCARHSLEVSAASMRVQLACLSAVAPSIASDASMAWWGLSRACHQHAYEIAPSHDEVRRFLARVRQLSG
ncbi:hypothetical protein [Phytoactinopolyspora mesophila]|uniref:Uncharacterized protein n=1 Tax=Phytoactinopolyspora mesophila TaxID=2650750 RepID=A0A7K3MAU9_9ACTN|nr:hypothetical protein [Phytoactinopolyspora mesophila]NDL60414.1 hypothetical protein [Phytoactinopolyspora mesophila]